MSFLFKNTNTHVALDIIIQNKYIKDDNALLDLFNKTGYDRSLQGIKQMIYELTRCGLITRDNFNDLRPTENALTIPKISDKKNHPDESTIEKCLKLINYLENNELFIKNTIIAFSKNLESNREILDYLLNLDVGFKSDDHSHIPAMKNFLVYLGILNETGDFTNLGSKILNYLPDEINYRLPKVWLEKTYLKNKEKGEYDIGKALLSPQKSNPSLKSKDGKKIYQSMTMTDIGDIVLHLAQDNDIIVGISKISSEVEEYPNGIPGLHRTESDTQRPWYLLRLSDYFEFKKSLPIYGENGVLSKNNQKELDQILNENSNLFYDKNHNLNQGSYFTYVPPRLLKLINDIYKRENGENLPYINLIENNHSSVYWFTIADSISDYYYKGIENEVWGVIEPLEHRIKVLKDGDYILFYGSDIGFSLCKTVGKPFRDDNPLFYNENFPHRIKITKPILETKSKSFSDVRDCLRDPNGNPYPSPNSAARSIGGTPGVFRKLRPEEIECIFSKLEWQLHEKIKITSNVEEDITLNRLLKSKKQIILYGPPGTGKTYKAREYAIEFISKIT